MRRKEEEDRKRAEMEARQKLKEDRMKAPVAKPAAPVPLKQLPSSSSQAPLQPSKSINQPSVIAAPPSAKKSVRASEAATALPAAAEDTFSLKPLPTVKGTPNSTKAHAMDSAQHPPLTPADLRNIQNLVASPYVSLAPASIKKPTIINYEISPYRPNADEEDEEEWAEQSRKKAVPEWTLPLNLAPALVLQGKMDPDRIFNWRQKTCPLEEIFEVRSQTTTSELIKLCLTHPLLRLFARVCRHCLHLLILQRPKSLRGIGGNEDLVETGSLIV